MGACQSEDNSVIKNIPNTNNVQIKNVTCYKLLKFIKTFLNNFIKKIKFLKEISINNLNKIEIELNHMVIKCINMKVQHKCAILIHFYVKINHNWHSLIKT